MSLTSLISSGTKVWLDGVEPEEIKRSRDRGITGATSNPAIVSEIIGKGQFDQRIAALLAQGLDDEAIAWSLDDELVKSAQGVFLPVFEETRGNDGYVSFELDPLIEDESRGLTHPQRIQHYIELGKKWSAGYRNRMIKVPATAAGLEALEELAALGVTINVTLMFTARQFAQASAAIWRGAQRRAGGLRDFKSVYSIFISRIDVYTEKHLARLSPATQGQVGIANAKRIWALNQAFWKNKETRLKQEIVFASTGVKKASEPPDKYVAALAGSDIQTNPAATNEAVRRANQPYARMVDQMPAPTILQEIDREVDMVEMERVLMEEGNRKFIDPQKALLALIGKTRAAI